MTSKKTYQKPDIIAICIDREISLIMMTYTNPDDPPDPGDVPPATQQNPYESNPFDPKQ
jgi:hypothetical protein